MAVTLLETKFFVPPSREGAVDRPRLEAVLSARRTPLTLVSAPAGFGKSTLLAGWLARRMAGAPHAALAWVALDESDRDAATFWTYVLTALDRAAPGVGSAGIGLLAAGQPVDAALAAVLNELSV